MGYRCLPERYIVTTVSTEELSQDGQVYVVGCLLCAYLVQEKRAAVLLLYGEEYVHGPTEAGTAHRVSDSLLLLYIPEEDHVWLTKLAIDTSLFCFDK